MMMSEKFVRTEDNHRRDSLRDQGRTNVGKFAVAAVVGAMVLAACGIPTETGAGAANVRAVNLSSILTDNGPTWKPNLKAFVLKGSVAPAIEFGGMAAPNWRPDQKALEDLLDTPNTGVIGNSEPFGYPNYGRLETYLGALSQSGPR